MNNKNKKCSKCNEQKPIEDFHKNSGRSDGYRPRCKNCENNPPKKKKCKVCGNEFQPLTSLNKYCSFDCARNAKNLAKRKNLGQKKCIQCGGLFKPYTSLDKFCSAQCRFDHQKAQRSRNWDKEKAQGISGENNPSYRNGFYTRKSKKNAQGEKIFIKNSKILKQIMIDNLGYVCCQNCQTSNSPRFETHHIVYRSEKPNHEHLHDLRNLIVVCIQCHNEFHKKKSMRNDLVEERKLYELFGQDVRDK